MNKIVGFTISRQQISHTDIDIFKAGLRLLEFEVHGLFIIFWGIGDIDHCKINNKYTLSFPYTENLYDRNILIYINNGSIIIENDWLGSIPVFYNQEKGIISTLSLKTNCNNELHSEGLKNYLRFGYSVFEQTPFNDTKFMRFLSKIIINKIDLNIELKRDVILDTRLADHKTTEEELFNKIKMYINNFESNTVGKIIVPTSGGFDSRLINFFIEDKKRIKSYSYGISTKQFDSIEIKYAQKLSELLDFEWKAVHLNSFYNYLEDWFKIFGVSTHLHGMYHIDFYKKIQADLGATMYSLLSGIIGDGWSGKVIPNEVNKASDLIKLGLAHGISLKEEDILLKNDDYLLNDFYSSNINFLKVTPNRIVMLIRFKIILLSYLVTIPEYFGWPSGSPFFNMEIVLGMLSLPEDRRKSRVWQTEFFKKNHLLIEELNIKVNKTNTLDYNEYVQTDAKKLTLEFEKFDGIISQKLMRRLDSRISKTKDKKKIEYNINQLFRSKISNYLLEKLVCYKANDINIIAPFFLLKTLEKALNKNNLSQT